MTVVVLLVVAVVDDDDVAPVSLSVSSGAGVTVSLINLRFVCDSGLQCNHSVSRVSALSNDSSS